MERFGVEGQKGNLGAKAQQMLSALPAAAEKALRSFNVRKPDAETLAFIDGLDRLVYESAAPGTALEPTEHFFQLANAIQSTDFPPIQLTDGVDEISGLRKRLYQAFATALGRMRADQSETSRDQLAGLAKRILEDQRTEDGTNQYSYLARTDERWHAVDRDLEDIVGRVMDSADEKTSRQFFHLFMNPALVHGGPREQPFSPGIMANEELSALKGEPYFRELKFVLKEEEGRQPLFLWRRAFLLRLRAVDQVQTRSDIDDISDWMLRDPSSFFVREQLAKTFSDLDAPYSIKKMLGLLAEKPQKHVKELLTYMLFRLENRELPVGEDGVTYLETSYDLGAQNRTSNSAKRLTPDGKVGIFAQDRTLQSYFKAELPLEKGKRVKATLREVTLEDLFYPDETETIGSRKEKEDLRKIYLRDCMEVYQKELYDICGLVMNNFSLREQGAFITLLSRIEKNHAEKMNLYLFLSTYQEAGMKALLSAQFQPEQLSEVLALARIKTPPQAQERIREVLRRFGEIAEKATSVTDELLSEFVIRRNGRSIDRRRIEEELMRKSSAALVDYANASTVEELGGRRTQRALNALDKDVVMVGAVFKALLKGRQKQKHMDFSEFRGLDLSEKTTAELTEEDRAQMLDLLEANWKEVKPEAYASMRRELFPEVGHPLYRTATFQLLRRDGRIIAFFRLEPDPREPDAVRADHLNVDTGLQDSGVGSAFLQETLNTKARHKVIRGEFYPEASVGATYIERFGFIGTGIGSDAEGGSEKKHQWIEMRRDDRSAEYLSRTPEVTLQTIKQWKIGMAPPGIVVRTVKEAPGEFLGKALTAIMEEESKNMPAKVLTRYVVEKQKGFETRYFVFEDAQAAQSAASNPFEPLSVA